MGTLFVRGNNPPVFYLVGLSQGFEVDWGGSSVNSGTLTPQSTPPEGGVTNASLSGIYLGGSQPPMLTHAFATWQALRVCFHTDVRNQRSRAALLRIGGQFEGILRSHRMAADFIARDSARFSIVAAEWQEVKQRLTRLLDQA